MPIWGGTQRTSDPSLLVLTFYHPQYLKQDVLAGLIVKVDRGFDCRLVIRENYDILGAVPIRDLEC